MPYIPIQCADQCFAPSVDTVAFTYGPAPGGRYGSLTVEVYDYANVLVYSALHDCEAGQPVLQWDGTNNQGGGANEPFATPLRSPYTAKVQAVIMADAPVRPSHLSASSGPPGEAVRCHLMAQAEEPPAVEEPVLIEPVGADNVQLEVLYHSIEIVRGPWLATGQVFAGNSAEGICDRLNALGYYAGPPARVAVDATFLNKAKERFRRNCGALRIVPLPTNDQYDAALTAALGTPRPTLTDDAGTVLAVGATLAQPGAEPMRIYLESIGFQADFAADIDEFNDQYEEQPSSKAAQDTARLNRPLIPLEAVIYLQDRAGARTAAPRAVGNVRVDWRATEPVEDTSTLPFDEAVACGTRTYIHRLFRKLPLAGPQQTNCLDRYGGIRTVANNYRNPFWREAQPYAPYAVPVDDDAARAVHVPASTDPNHAPRIGRSGLYFHPSLIGGDRYQLTATLSFDGRPNAVALAQANADKRYQTAPMVVWRRAEVVAIVGWPTVALGNLALEVQREYAHAYVELDFTATTYPEIGAVLNDQHYAQWMQHILLASGSLQGPQFALEVDLAHIRANPLHLLLPADQLTQQAEIGVMVDHLFSELHAPGQQSPSEFLTEQLAFQLRLGHPSGGLMALHYRQHDDVRAACEVGMGAIPTLSVGNADLVAIIDQAVPGAPAYIFAHEAGHCFWLRHHQNAPDSDKSVPDHDQYDHNCIMSYTRELPPSDQAHQTAALYSPHFCGKCNLKLRGWNILHADILALDAPAVPDALKTLFYYDAADPELNALTELQTVRDAVTAVSRGRFRQRSFNANAVFETWMAQLGDCDIYHHVSHGNTRCQRHGRRAPTLELLTPRYPLCCREEATRETRLINEESELGVEAYDRAKLEAWAAKRLIKPDEFIHKLRGVIQWTMVAADSSLDIEFTYDQVDRAIKAGQRTPRLLAFFSTCLLGWDSGFAKLFINAGTRYVIAFRSRYETAQALAFSKTFYGEWQRRGLDPTAVIPSFYVAALERPHAEPVLFTLEHVFRVWATTMYPGSGEIVQLGWNQTEDFAAPHFPNR